jgi:hypothetical protein
MIEKALLKRFTEHPEETVPQVIAAVQQEFEVMGAPITYGIVEHVYRAVMSY